MVRACAIVVAAMLAAVPASGQTRSPSAKPSAKPAASSARRVEAAAVTCPSPLGIGVATKRAFCDVPIGRTPADGITITIPPHRGPTTLTFDLHNRQIFSEDLVRAKRSYARLTATIGVLTMDNTLITRAVVQSEYRTAQDLFDRIGGGAGPGGLKAVAPTGVEPIRVELPAEVGEVCLLGEKLAAKRQDADELFTGPGRPIAIVSDVRIEYQPAPAPAAKAPAARPAPKKR
ncbi:MAG TPA: hypothetical protein PLE61_12050 [Vicinamibacterales bacterium]|nr:hypothetical protein [Vicinamibacterales bacterium]HPW21535.1 hypothetical protein [Vicinamibacterales bacterium]